VFHRDVVVLHRLPFGVGRFEDCDEGGGESGFGVAEHAGDRLHCLGQRGLQGGGVDREAGEEGVDDSIALSQQRQQQVIRVGRLMVALFGLGAGAQYCLLGLVCEGIQIHVVTSGRCNPDISDKHS